MKIVQLDFLRGQAPTSPLQWMGAILMVMLGGALAGYGWLLHVQMDNLTKDEVQIMQGAARKREIPAGPAQTQAQLTEALKTGDRISRQLNIPWDRLFIGLEASQFKDVALLEIQPDAAAAKVRISAEARDQVALRDYMNTLWGLEDFSGVFLVRQKINDKVAENPVQFTLDARWRSASSQ